MKTRIDSHWWVARGAILWDFDPKTHTIEKAEGTREAKKLERRAKANNWAFKFVPNGNGCYGMYARTDGVALRPKTDAELEQDALIKSHRVEEANVRRKVPLPIRIALAHTDPERRRCFLWSERAEIRQEFEGMPNSRLCAMMRRGTCKNLLGWFCPVLFTTKTR